MSENPFHVLRIFQGSRKFYSLPQLEAQGIGAISRLPVSIRILLESVLRNCDGERITVENVQQLARWQPNAERTEVVPLVVSRVLLQDFTGVPLVVDLAAMRSVVARLGRDPNIVKPMVPVDLVIDQRKQVARGADEIDIVNSGLEETMVVAYREIHQIWKSDARIQRLRTASYGCTTDPQDNFSHACSLHFESFQIFELIPFPD